MKEHWVQLKKGFVNKNAMQIICPITCKTCECTGCVNGTCSNRKLAELHTIQESEDEAQIWIDAMAMLIKDGISMTKQSFAIQRKQ